jgi:hypothetical protein
MSALVAGGMEPRALGRLLAAVCALVLVGDLTALLTVDADNGGSSGDALQQYAPSSDAGSSALPGQSSAAPPPPSPGTAEGGQKGSAPPAAAAPPATLKQGWDFVATLTPTCGAIGRQFKLTLVLGDKGTAVFTAVYGDATTQRESEFAEAGPDGTYSYTWTAAPAPGDGWVIIAAADATQANSGTKSIPFHVVGPAEQC